ncbi:MAG TPA: L,D-transpeptidase family protein, partial [Vicinamibacteria bacterium]|nr:L,D-transpeptidase family protein [Vicinamibacteria bacterium]
PARGGGVWRGRRARLDVLSVLQEAAQTGRPDAVLERLRPLHPQYDALRAGLRRVAALREREPEVPVIPEGLKLRPGHRSPHVAALRARLAFWGDLADAASGDDAFDPPLVEALRAFEARHGLPADGVLDAAAVEALNTPVGARVGQIELNLERWRWQERVRGRRSVLVNIPTFMLHAYDPDGTEALAMRVVTGKPGSPTPVFDQEMTSVVFSPYWNIPPGIAGRETLPAVRRDRGYLRRMNLEVLRGGAVVDPSQVDWRRGAARVSFRQRPGPGNSLGLVKFQMPNPFHVYLHDTPADSLFRRERRTFSHGCVRLEKPEALARWVLSEQPEWTAERIAGAMRAGRQRAVALPEPISVSISYYTVWVDADGAVQFRPDVYRHDAGQGRLLDALEPPAMEAPAAAAAVAG